MTVVSNFSCIAFLHSSVHTIRGRDLFKANVSKKPYLPRFVMCDQSSVRRATLAADLTKWTVTTIVAGGFLYRRDATALLYLICAMINTGVAKVLKRILNKPRPSVTTREDPGMPSSHATSLSYLSLAIFFYVLREQYGISAIGISTSLVLLAIIACSWRIRAGYHTTAQICAGWLVGAIDAALWAFVIDIKFGGSNPIQIQNAVQLVISAIILIGFSLQLFKTEIKQIISRRKSQSD